MAKSAHVVTLDGKKYSIMAEDIYAAIADTVGITKAPSPDNTDYAGKLEVNKAIQSGDLVRIRVRLETKKYKNVLCVTTKFASAMAGLLTKKVAGVDVKSTGIQRRMRLG